MHLEALDRFDHGWARSELEALFADIHATYPHVRAGSAGPGQITLLFAPAVIGFAAPLGPRQRGWQVHVPMLGGEPGLPKRMPSRAAVVEFLQRHIDIRDNYW